MVVYLNVTTFVFLAATATYFGLFSAGSSSIFVQVSSVDNVVSTVPTYTIKMDANNCRPAHYR